MVERERCHAFTRVKRNYLFSLTRFTTVSILNPAIFSIAKFIAEAITPVSIPTKKAMPHFRVTYCNTSIFVRFLQSCLKRSLSFILH